MDKFLYKNHPVQCIITGPSGCGKSIILTNRFSNVITDDDKINIYSLSLHQASYRKLVKCFINNIPIHILPSIPNGEDIDGIIDEIVNDTDFEKSDTETGISIKRRTTIPTRIYI